MDSKYLISVLNPAQLFYITAIVSVIIHTFSQVNRFLQNAIKMAMLLMPVLAIIVIWLRYADAFGNVEVISEIESMSLFFAKGHIYLIPLSWIVCIVVFMTILSGFKRKISQLSTYLLYGGSAIGALFSSDLMTAFIYLELMEIFSIAIVLKNIKHKNLGLIYALIHCVAGVLMLTGIVGYFSNSADNNILSGFSLMQIGSWNWIVPAILFFIGLLINLGLPPFSYAITECYPSTDPLSASILSAISTKIMLFFFINMFPGTQLLLYIGIIFIVYSSVQVLVINNIGKISTNFILMHIGIVLCMLADNYEFFSAEINLYCAVSMLSIYMLMMLIAPIGYGNSNMLYLKNLHFIHKTKNGKTIAFFVILYCWNLMNLPMMPGNICESIFHYNMKEHSAPIVLHIIKITQVISIIVAGKIIASLFNLWKFTPADYSKMQFKIVPKELLAGAGLTALVCVILGTFFRNRLNIIYFNGSTGLIYSLPVILSDFKVALGVLTLTFCFLPLFKPGKKMRSDIQLLYINYIIPLIKAVKVFIFTMNEILSSLTVAFNYSVKKYIKRIKENGIVSFFMKIYTLNTIGIMLIILLTTILLPILILS